METQRAHLLDRRYLTTPEGEVLQVTNILDQLRQPDGSLADLTNWVIENDFGIVVGCGEPGIGKSRTLEELAENLKIKGRRTHLLLFDNILAQTIEEIYEETGVRYDDPLKLPDDVWNYKFADNVVKKVAEKQQEIDKYYEEHPEEEYKDIILLDFVGLIEIYGRKALERLIEIYGKRLGIIAMAPDVRVQQINGTLRYLVTRNAENAPEQVEERMRQYPYNIRCFWKPPEPETPEEKGKKLGQIAERAASSRIIQVVSTLVTNKIDNNRDIERIRGMLAGMMAQAVEEGKLPQVELSSFGFLIKRVAYLFYQLSGLELPPENSRIVLNIYREDDPIVWVINH